MRLYRHITSFRILRNPCNKQGFHSTARHFIPDNPHNVSNPPGSEMKMLSQHKAYEMVKNMNELDRDNLRCALNQFELDQIKIKFEDCPRRTCILAGGPCFTQIKENATQFFCTNCTVFEKLDREYLDCVTEFINTKSDEANKKVRLVYQAKDANKTVTFSIGNIINSSDEWNKDHGYHLSWTVFKHSTMEAHAVIPPSKDDLMKIMIVNAVPFLGFGFLDNFFMIIAGDYIEHTMGVYMCISTMAAAGFGNTISDVLGLGLAHYVERFCEFLGLRPPKLTQEQMELRASRRVASYGRALGIMVGCLLGMFPLWFINKKKPEDEAGKDNETPQLVKL